jgi:thiol:disulfide interchange protein
MLFLRGTGEEGYTRVIGYKSASELVPTMKKALGSVAARAEELVWYTDIDQAFAKAQETNRIVFVDVYTVWCSWCKKLEQETFQDPSFKQVAQKFVLLKVDAEKEYDFAYKYKVRAYPTMLFLKANGEEKHRVLGYLSAEELVPIMESVLQPIRASETLFWHTDIEAAFKEATAQKRLVFVDVYKKDCSWCKKLETETFRNPEFIRVAGMYTLLKVDAQKEYEFVRKYKVHAYPTMLFLKADRTQVHSLEGFLPAEELVPIMRKILETEHCCSFAK